VSRLTFEVADFDIGYKCILWRSFLIKFMAVIHLCLDEDIRTYGGHLDP
jgi:hypothetical protein